MTIFIFYILLPVLLIIPFEFITFCLHKYVMHGFGWAWHQSHHEKQGKGIEKNDWFILVFSLVAILLFLISSLHPSNSYLSIITRSLAIGWCLYGVCYFMVHDIVIHRRISNNFVKKIKNPYLKRLIRAHAIHHKHIGKEHSKAFGFLYASNKYRFPSASTQKGDNSD
jgi:beta-carotene 3-hydroxylase